MSFEGSPKHTKTDEIHSMQLKENQSIESARGGEKKQQQLIVLVQIWLFCLFVTVLKISGNLLVVGLEEVLTPEVVSPADFIDSEYLKTLVVIVPK